MIKNQKIVNLQYCRKCWKDVLKTHQFTLSHNKNILTPVLFTEYGCNCRSKGNYAHYKTNVTPEIVYPASAKNPTNDEKMFYLGVTEIPFKERFDNHTRDFNNLKYGNSTELSKYGNSKMLIYHQFLSGVLLQKCYQKHPNFCKLPYFF